MTEKKDFVAYDHSSDWGLIISGGYDGEKYFETVENTLDSLNFESLPDLPKEQYIGCLAIVDEETLFATGGKTNDVGDNETYIYRYRMFNTVFIWFLIVSSCVMPYVRH